MFPRHFTGDTAYCVKFKELAFNEAISLLPRKLIDQLSTSGEVIVAEPSLLEKITGVSDPSIYLLLKAIKDS